MLGVAPAQQRLDPGHAPAGQIDLRLVVQLELIAVDPLAHLPEQQQPSRVEAVEALGVGLDPAVRRTGARQRRIGVLEQVVQSLLGAVGRREPDARVDVDRDAVDDDRRLERVLHALGGAQRAAEPVCLRTEDRKLVRADARHQRRVTELRRQPSRRLAEHRVAGGVAERSVDLGEPLEVDQQDGQRIALDFRPIERRAHPLAKQRAVGQRYERVITGQHVVLARLAAQSTGGLRDDAKQHCPQQCQADRHDQGDHALVARQRNGDRPVAEIDLERAGRVTARGEAERHVDLDEFAQADLAARLAVRTGRDDLAARALALQRLGQIAGRREAATDQAVVVGVNDGVRRVPDLDAGELLGRLAIPQLLVELAHLRRRQADLQLARRQAWLDADARDQACRLVGVGDAVGLHLMLDHARQREPEQHHRHQAEHGDALGQGEPCG